MKYGYRIALMAMALASGHAIAQTKKVTYYYTDPQGTVLAEADESGNIIATHDYKPYGEPVGSQDAQGPGYTGHVNDPDTGLVYMQARYYDPVAKRFLSIDPIASSAGNIHNFNRFEYANNDPIGNIDTNGRVVTSLNAANNPSLTSYINAYAKGQYAFVGDTLQRVGDGHSGTSAYYASRLDALIASPTNVVLDIADTYTKESGDVISVDRVAGGGLTQPRSNGDVFVTISGNDNNSATDVGGAKMSATPKDILLHEIVGHAAPIALGRDTGNAVTDENKARSEISGLKERAPDPSHLEGVRQAPSTCGLLCTQ